MFRLAGFPSVLWLISAKVFYLASGSLASLEVDREGDTKRWGNLFESKDDAKAADAAVGSADVKHEEVAVSSEQACANFNARPNEEVTRLGAGFQMDGNSCKFMYLQGGLNFSPQFAKFLVHQLKPRSALEYGCGFGTYSDFVARFAGADVTCIDGDSTISNEMLTHKHRDGEAKGGSLKQFALNITDKATDACLASLSHEKVDLTFSLEVAQHIPAKLHPAFVQLLVDKTSRWLVFSAARPEQMGHGHLSESMLTPDQWRKIFEDKGLVYMENLTKIARNAAYWYRGWDLHANTLVFKHPNNAAPDTDIPTKKLREDFFGGVGSAEEPDWQQVESFMHDDNMKKRMEEANLKVTKNLWPELHETAQKIKDGSIPCRRHSRTHHSHHSPDALARSQSPK